ncbi:MAG: glycosyltransferase family 39 protein, partial [Elusimicrobia bacterium]|nr:glycosyltransferase family 39 protein [Elusimicrobiota bacterium]
MRVSLVLSLAVFCFLGWSTIDSAAPTYDEPVHLASGCAALRTGRLINAMDHPPLAEMWAALPLLPMRPTLFLQHPDWLQGRVYNYADLFLYKNRLDAQRMLDTARFWCLLSFGLLLAVGILTWARRLAGAPAAAAAGLLLAFCPPLFTNAALVTTDTCGAAFFFLTFQLLSRERRGTWTWIAAGTCAGAALASKFSMFVLPAFAA